MLCYIIAYLNYSSQNYHHLTGQGTVGKSNYSNFGYNDSEEYANV